MPIDRTKQLVYELDAWYRGHKLRQKDLAAELGLTAQALSEILSLRNRPGSEATLRIVEFLETENMKSELVDPPAMPRESTRDPNEPQTLGSAKEMIHDLRQELAQLKAAAAAPPKPAVPPPLPAKLTAIAPTPTATGNKPATTMSAWEKEVARASAARLEGLSSKPLEQQTIDELRIALNVETDSNRKTQIFKLIQLRKEENSLSNPRVRLRGA